MDPEYVSIVLAVLVVGAAGCLVAPRVWTAVGLLVASTVWIPANNGKFEGPVLLSVGERHGLTMADVLGVCGIALSAYTISRLSHTGELSRRWGDPLLVGLLAVLVTGIGFAVAFVTG